MLMKDVRDVYEERIAYQEEIERLERKNAILELRLSKESKSKEAI